MTKGLIHQKDTKIININVSNRAPKDIKEKLTDLEKEITQ